MTAKIKDDATRGARRQRIRERFQDFRGSRKFGMIGAPEVVGLILSGLFLVVVIASYFYLLTPARARLKSVQSENERLRTKIATAQQGVDMNASPQATVDEINRSLDDFENGALLVRSQGRLELYSSLNEMLRRHKLRNTAGPVYAPLDPIGGPGAPASAGRAGNARWQSPYPGISISVTIEGPYADLRRFLNEVESNRHFIVINAVEFEGVSDAVSENGPKLVSLRLDMATYFRRENATSETVSDAETR